MVTEFRKKTKIPEIELTIFLDIFLQYLQQEGEGGCIHDREGGGEEYIKRGKGEMGEGEGECMQGKW